MTDLLEGQDCSVLAPLLTITSTQVVASEGRAASDPAARSGRTSI